MSEPILPNEPKKIVMETRVGADATASVAASASASAEVLTYPRRLLDLARSFIDQGQPSIAVVVAHMACEVATERKISEAFAAKGIRYLEDAIMSQFASSGYNLGGNNRLRTLYAALTGDNNIQTMK